MNVPGVPLAARVSHKISFVTGARYGQRRDDKRSDCLLAVDPALRRCLACNLAPFSFVSDTHGVRCAAIEIFVVACGAVASSCSASNVVLLACFFFFFFFSHAPQGGQKEGPARRQMDRDF